ncbi:MAG TPA: VCBS repeat-containing protein, partial [Actinomycetota bacterium]|nr:VCBS repeat-containing protein [Actinomycetota bacterium]
MALIGLALIAFLIPIQPPTGTPSHPTGGGLEVVDVAAEAGIDETTTSWGLATSDFDDDGLPDLFLGRHLEAARLYRNVGGGRFLEVEPGTFPARDRHDCAWADVDLDDLVDLYCSIGAEHGTATKANELWMQQPDHSFVDRATELGVADPYGRGRRVTFIDANGDAYPDLFVGNLYPRQDDVPSPNRLFINRGGRFREAPRFGLTEEVGAGCAQAADFDDDGWEDLLVCGLDSLHLYRNRDGEGFHDVSGSVGVSGKSR